MDLHKYTYLYIHIDTCGWKTCGTSSIARHWAQYFCIKRTWIGITVCGSGFRFQGFRV